MPKRLARVSPAHPPEEHRDLSPEAAAALSLSDDERIMRIRSPRWIGYTRATEILNELEDLLEHPKTNRMPNLLIVGETNNGKTEVLKKFLRKHPEDPNPDGEHIIIPVLQIQSLPGPDEAQLYRAILDKINAQPRRNEKVDVHRARVIQLLSDLDVKMLVLDEIHNLIVGPAKKQRHFLNVIKYLGNELRIPIVGAGTKEAYHAVQIDPQISNRFEPITLPRWRMGDDYIRLLASFERALPLRRESNLADEAIATKLLAKTNGLLGELSRLLGKAAVAAIRQGRERIDEKLLKEVRWTAPGDRRRGVPADA